MARFTVTPWRTQQDLLSVRSQLYSSAPTSTDEPDLRRHAVNRVMAWKLRGNLPHAVESTAVLIDAQLHHDIAVNSAFSVRAVYSAAFCRFVTGFCDIGRAKERMLEPSSMLEIARQIGMPGEFVALRHEATHEELPGVGRMVAASRQALEWLWRVYWSKLEEPETVEQVMESLPRVKGEARKVFKEYRGQRREILRSGKKKSAIEVHLEEQLRATSAICKELVGRHRLRVNALAEVLVDEKLLVPSSRGLGSPMGGAFLIWDELIAKLAREYEAFPVMLVRRIFDSLHADSVSDPAEDVEKEAAYLWLVHLVDDEQVQLRPGTQDHLRTDLMKWCCLYPGYWTRIYGQKLLENRDEFFQDCWEELFEASMLQEHNLVTAASNDDQDMLVDEVESSVPGRHVPAGHFEDEESPKGWTRLAIAPNLPIGVL